MCVVLGEDFTPESVTSTFGACENQTCADLSIEDDDVSEGEESFSISLEWTDHLDRRIVLSPAEGAVYIQDDDRND